MEQCRAITLEIPNSMTSRLEASEMPARPTLSCSNRRSSGWETSPRTYGRLHSTRSRGDGITSRRGSADGHPGCLACSHMCGGPFRAARAHLEHHGTAHPSDAQPPRKREVATAGPHAHTTSLSATSVSGRRWAYGDGSGGPTASSEPAGSPPQCIASCPASANGWSELVMSQHRPSVLLPVIEVATTGVKQGCHKPRYPLDAKTCLGGGSH